MPEPYNQSILPTGVRSRFVDKVNGLRVHVLEAGFGAGSRPCVLLLHGFPELAFSWRKVITPLADAGFHVLAPDLRGYGRTTGWDDRYGTDLRSFGLLNYVRDALGLVSALGYRSVAAVVGHDFGSVVAPWCSIARADVFRSVVLMSAPFAGVPALPFNTAHAADPNKSESSSGENLDDALAKLNPPRKQYRTYYSSREANLDMIRAPQGLRAFLRAYYHMKSADWTPNKPVRPTSRTAGEFAKLPTYYVMELNKNMPDTVAPAMPSASEIAACRWLPDSELSVYVGEYQRTHFQGGLNGYRVRLTAAHNAELQLFSNRTVDVPSMWSIQGSCSSRIAFDAPEQSGRSDIWVISSAGGQPRQLTKGPATNAVPSFSPDGKWIYFRSVSAGRANIWRVPFQGGSAEQVTRNGGFVSFLSTDSKTLYYTKGAGIAEPLYAAWTVDAWPRLWMVASSTARNSVRVLMSDLEDLHS